MTADTRAEAGSAPAPILSGLWTAMLLSGVLTAVLGLVVLVWPAKSLIVVAALFGGYLVISGIAQVVFAFTLPVTAGGRVLLFISGAVSLVLGVLAFRHFGQGFALLLLAIWIAVGFILRGVATAGAAIGDPLYPGRGWAIFGGILTAVAGLIVLVWPFGSIAVLTLVVGIGLLVIGVFETVSGFQMRRDINNMRRDMNETSAVLNI